MLGARSLLTSTAEALDRRVGWDKLPRVLAIPTLIGLRTRLREKNLYDTVAARSTGRRSTATRRSRAVDLHARVPEFGDDSM